MTVTVEEVISALKSHKNVLLYGPPGTGKTYLMNEVARQFNGEPAVGSTTSEIDLKTESEGEPLKEEIETYRTIATRWVTFHQGYSYEDFIIGMRPSSGEGEFFSLVPRAGVLLELSAEVLNGRAGSLLLIDEINRGNASRIFGEFITLMEPSKRLGEDGGSSDTTVQVRLPYILEGQTCRIETSSGPYDQGQDFSMPAKVYTLASMNSVDKSIAPIDTALRRRFHVINLFPASEDFYHAVGLPPDDSGRLIPVEAMESREDLARMALAVITKLNAGIGLFLGQEFCLGQWYLEGLRDSGLTKDDAERTLAEIWNFRLLPQLLELFHGRIDQLVTLLEFPDPNYRGLILESPNADQEDLGAMPYFTHLPSTTEDTISYLCRLAGAPVLPADERQRPEEGSMAEPPRERA
jgi:5-methylcytosine-specific restriction protein B